MGDRAANLVTAVRLLAEAGLNVIERSKIYETLPVGNKAQGLFLNAAVAVETAMTPLELLDRCLRIESSMGRIRKEHWGPRIIDIDILMCDGIIIDDVRLTVPHPQMHMRAFVMKPLADIASEAVHPVLKMSIGELLAMADTSGICGVSGSL